jgi:steroid delta-isomerase-like uncharacterized protein
MMRGFRRVALLVTALLVLMAVAPPRGTAQEATPAAACVQTTPEQNVELVRSWFESLASGNSEDVAALAAPDVVYHAPSSDLPPQTDDAGTWADRRQQDYPDLTTTVEQVFASGDMVASYVRYTGTHSGDSEDAQGVPATGRGIEWVGMANFRIACGKIAEIWSVADDLGRLRRLGVITAEELQSVAPVATPTA